MARITQMFFPRSESESNADFAVSEDCILESDRTCQTVQVNSIAMQNFDRGWHGFHGYSFRGPNLKVAQICNLLYRRFSNLHGDRNYLHRLARPVALEDAILRHSEICVTFRFGP